MFILWIVLIAAGIYFWRNAHNSGACHHHHNHNHRQDHRPLDLLAERYARGEIELEEYQARRQELTRY